jgi:hypothetical protein
VLAACAFADVTAAAAAATCAFAEVAAAATTNSIATAAETTADCLV